MLVKKELATVPFALFEHIDYPSSRYEKPSHLVVAQVVELPRSGVVLAADIYDGWRLIARFFCNKKTFTVCHFDRAGDIEEWSQRCPDGLQRDYYSYGRVSASSKSTLFTINNFLSPDNHYYYGEGGDPFWTLWAFVNARRREAGWRAQKKIDDLTKKHIKMVGDLPADFGNYCEQNVFPTYFVFQNRSTKNRIVRCSQCDAVFEAGRAMVGIKTICPHCRTEGTFMGKHEMGTRTDWARVCVTKRHHGNFIVRYVKVKRYTDEYGIPSSYSTEDLSYLLYIRQKNGKIKPYSYHFVKQAYCWDWYRIDYVQTYDAFLYRKNIRASIDAVKDYFCINPRFDLAAYLKTETREFDLMDLLFNIARCPETEMLVKNGMLLLASSWTISAGELTSFEHFFEISKQYMAMYRRVNPSRKEHTMVKYAYNRNRWICERDFLRLRKLLGGQFDASDFDAAMDRMSLTRFLNYFEKVKINHPCANLGQLWVWYNDYYCMCQRFNIDLSRKSVRFPIELKAAHDHLAMQRKAADEILENQEKARRAEAEAERIKAEMAKKKKEIAKLKNWIEASGLQGFSHGLYQITIPTSYEEFVTEGTSLGHCLANGTWYFDYHIARTRMIFFVRRRKNPETPYVTMQVKMDPLSITQLNGFGDTPANIEVRRFAKRFLKQLERAIEVPEKDGLADVG